MVDANKLKTVSKVLRYKKYYHKHIYNILREEKCEIAAGGHERFTVPPDSEFRNIAKGENWGGEQVYAWFRCSTVIDESLEGKELWIMPDTGAAEGLLFLNGKPSGMFDCTDKVSNPQTRLHNIQPLTDDAKIGERFTIAIESYAGQTSFGCMPFESIGDCDHFYPYKTVHQFKGIYIVEKDDMLERFLYGIEVLRQLYNGLPETNFMKWQITNIFEEIFRYVPTYPEEYPYEVWHAGVLKSVELMKEVLDRKSGEDDDIYGEVGLIGHSHLDTAWQWPVRETVHKAARTFAQALAVMNRYPEYIFIQSSVLYIDWMRKYYPDIYEGIKKRTAEGRWEPNGGSWVECDGNMTGGEYLIRQFVKGQRYLKENLGYTADCFWQPDTFGYSASIPQILRGCGIKYFLTTKLSWNECNRFPYDSFIWKGIDASEVITHFNITHCWPDAEAVMKNVKDIPNKDVSDMKLISYGYGDGGGGPSYSMLESARMCSNIKGLPKAEHTTVSRFMKKLEEKSKNLPVYDGELYLELHRGTLTQKHDIKRSNRKFEIALRNAELLDAHSALLNHSGHNSELDKLTETLLLNQFHDILPGTSLQEVHELAIKQNYGACERAKEISEEILAGKKENGKLTVYNPLSWEWKSQIVTDDSGVVPKGYEFQRFTDLKGKAKIAVKGICVPPLSSVALETEPAAGNQRPSAFEYKDNVLKTPYAVVTFNEYGAIKYFVHIETGRELVKNPENPLNTFLFGEDIPDLWDNWDIDLDQKSKMKPVKTLLERSVVSDGALQLRIRSRYSLGQHSEIKQDMVFYSDSERIDFETVVDWREDHSLLKTSFDVDIRAKHAKHEIQFGYVERETTANNSIEKSKFEVCNHKWSCICENRFGAALLNDCKYGISVDGSDMRLTLHKGGCHPDISGDRGVHEFVYSFLPFSGGFSSEKVVCPAYELNNPPLVSENTDNVFASLLETHCRNIIAETVKTAEDGDGIIVRLYEAECNKTNVRITFNSAVRKVTELNMLEDEKINDVVLAGQTASLTFRPFEIKTLKLYY